MKVVILCGGMGTRLTEETQVKPKPMVEIGGHPVLWHIMRIYASSGFKEFVLALGYKGDVIKDYFVSYRHRTRNLTVDLSRSHVRVHGNDCEDDWTVHLLDTGMETQTGGRVKRAAEFVGNEPFLMTYGDGVANVDVKALMRLHHEQGKLATVTAVLPPPRFGGLALDGNLVTRFEEKPQIGEGWINGGFFVLEPAVAGYITDDATYWEREPMERLVQERQLVAYRHTGFWQCMDTMRDVRLLNSLWDSGEPPWKVW